MVINDGSLAATTTVPQASIAADIGTTIVDPGTATSVVVTFVLKSSGAADVGTTVVGQYSKKTTSCSRWRSFKSVLSGVPQGSVLGLILFLIYINDFDDSITSNVLKLADDTKLFRKVNTDGDKQHLQNDLDRLVKWSEKWQMLFNFGKCKCLHTGHGNLNVNYKMGDTVLGTTVKEKDLGVTISADMKVSE